MTRSLVLGTLLAATFASTAALAGTGLAGDIGVESRPFGSIRTPAEVQAELAQFRQSGVNPWSASYNPLRSFRSTRTPAEVQREFLASRDEVRALGSEDSGSAWLAQHRVLQGGAQLAGEPPRQQ